MAMLARWGLRERSTRRGRLTRQAVKSLRGSTAVRKTTRLHCWESVATREGVLWREQQRLAMSPGLRTESEEIRKMGWRDSR